MAKREMNLKVLKAKLRAVFLLAAVLGTSAAAQAPTTSELLQKGIYLQETVGDLDGAMKVYRQIVHLARESRANAAEAEFRLGMCLLKKGQNAEAVNTFQALIKEYPEQTELVAKAHQFTDQSRLAPKAQDLAPPVSRPGDLKLLPAPWKDGEVVEYTRKKKDDSKGFKIWRLFQSSKTHANHWLLEEHGAGLFDRLEFNPETMAPANLFEATDSHSFHASYQVKLVQISEGEKSLSIVLDGPAFDARELPAILARLPWTKGYKVTLPLFWTSSGRVVQDTFTVIGEENIKVPAGEFRCYQIETDDLTDRMFAVEKLWIATDATHVIVKSVRGDWTDELSASAGADPEESVYRDEQTGASFKVPSGWMVEGPRRGEQMVNWYLTDLHSAAFVTLRVFPHEPGDFTPSEIQSEVEKQAADRNDRMVRPESWHIRQIDRNVAVSWIEDMPRYSQVRYRAWVRTGAAGADIFADADPPSFDALRPTFDAILESLALR